MLPTEVFFLPLGEDCDGNAKWDCGRKKREAPSVFLDLDQAVKERSRRETAGKIKKKILAPLMDKKIFGRFPLTIMNLFLRPFMADGLRHNMTPLHLRTSKSYPLDC